MTAVRGDSLDLDDPHMITCTQVGLSGPFGRARLLAYKLWDELDDDELDEETLEYIAKRTASMIGAAYGNARPTKALIKKWLTNPAVYSPWLDEVALARASEFDWGAIENLTEPEWSELVRRFAAAGGIGLSPGVARGPAKEARTDRDERWYAGPLHLREKLTNQVSARASEARAAAAA